MAVDSTALVHPLWGVVRVVASVVLVVLAELNPVAVRRVRSPLLRGAVVAVAVLVRVVGAAVVVLGVVEAGLAVR